MKAPFARTRLVGLAVASAGNEILMTTSSDGGQTWTTPVLSSVSRITSNGGDHFIPGIGIDPTTSASAPTGSTFNEALYVPAGGLSITDGALSSVATPVVTSGHRDNVNSQSRNR